jgi:hypothetical protein
MAAKAGRRRRKIEQFLQKEFNRVKSNLPNHSFVVKTINENRMQPELQETPLNAL